MKESLLLAEKLFQVHDAEQWGTKEAEKGTELDEEEKMMIQQEVRDCVHH